MHACPEKRRTQALFSLAGKTAYSHLVPQTCAILSTTALQL